jgi:hypothetical protein
MAHRSREPGRLQARKKRLPRSRGEKYVAPAEDPLNAGIEPVPPGARGAGRRGKAHELVRSSSPRSLRRSRRTSREAVSGSENA